ncbi:MAG: DUF1616 domain-containing protein [Methanosarcina sp.]
MTRKIKLPIDLLLVAGLVLLTDILVLVPVLSGSFLRTDLGILMVLLLPGYALTAAIFPAKKDLEGLERALISLGLSISIVPLLGLILNYTNWGIREIPLLVALSAFTLLMCVIAYYRRTLLSEIEAFEIPFKASLASMKTEVLEKPETKIDKAIAVLLVFSVFAAIGSLAYIIANPKQGEPFTEFYVLGANKTAEDYQTEFMKGETGTVILGIANHENEPVDYTIDLRLENRSLPLPENQKHIRLEDNETWEEPVTFTLPQEGKNMKLEFLLFNEAEKDTPYRNLYLWINATAEA